MKGYLDMRLLSSLYEGDKREGREREEKIDRSMRELFSGLDHGVVNARRPISYGFSTLWEPSCATASVIRHFSTLIP